MPGVTSVLRVWGRKSVSALIVLGSTLAAYAVVSAWRQDQARAQAPGGTVVGDSVRKDNTTVNPFASANGTHLIAFVVTASDCGWSTRPQVVEAVRGMRAKLQAVHGDSYAQVSVFAVVIDKELEAGLRFLAELRKDVPDGAFDQAIIGGSWLNEQIVRFVWREGLTRASTPQVLVIERPVNTESYLTGPIVVQGDKLLLNPRGREIVNWVKRGVPLDMQSLASR